MLLRDDEPSKAKIGVVPIVGMGGIGNYIFFKYVNRVDWVGIID